MPLSNSSATMCLSTCEASGSGNPCSRSARSAFVSCKIASKHIDTGDGFPMLKATNPTWTQDKTLLESIFRQAGGLTYRAQVSKQRFHIAMRYRHRIVLDRISEFHDTRLTYSIQSHATLLRLTSARIGMLPGFSISECELAIPESRLRDEKSYSSALRLRQGRLSALGKRC